MATSTSPRIVGTVETVVTWLEMLEPPRRAPAQPPDPGLEVVRAVRPTVSFYRYLYDTVGGPWLWTDRRQMDEATLRAIIQDPANDLRVLWCEGVPAGYAELDLRAMPEIRIAYFGLIPEFIGRGIGRFLLDWTVDHAWRMRPTRLWVHTCDLDHPRALTTYEAAGFVAYDQATDTVPLLEGMELPAHRRG
jgi:GNAT superfamily N-acetyltransferase